MKLTYTILCLQMNPSLCVHPSFSDVYWISLLSHCLQFEKKNIWLQLRSSTCVWSTVGS